MKSMWRTRKSTEKRSLEIRCKQPIQQRQIRFSWPGLHMISQNAIGSFNSTSLLCSMLMHFMLYACFPLVPRINYKNSHRGGLQCNAHHALLSCSLDHPFTKKWHVRLMIFTCFVRTWKRFVFVAIKKKQQWNPRKSRRKLSVGPIKEKCISRNEMRFGFV